MEGDRAAAPVSDMRAGGHGGRGRDEWRLRGRPCAECQDSGATDAAMASGDCTAPPCSRREQEGVVDLAAAGGCRAAPPIVEDENWGTLHLAAAVSGEPVPSTEKRADFLCWLRCWASASGHTPAGVFELCLDFELSVRGA